MPDDLLPPVWRGVAPGLYEIDDEGGFRRVDTSTATDGDAVLLEADKYGPGQHGVRFGSSSPGSGSIPTRQTLTFTTPPCVAGGTVAFSVPLPAGCKGIRPLVVSVDSKSGRLRLYGTAAKRDDAAEGSRAITADPDLLGRVSGDWQLDSRCGWTCDEEDPTTIVNRDTSPTNVLYARWHNQMTLPVAATFTIVYEPTES